MGIILKLSRKISNGNIKYLRGIFLIINMLAAALAGFTAWGVVNAFVGASIIALVCAVGYPVIFAGLIGGVLYLMNRNLW